LEVVPVAEHGGVWSVADAKAHLSELIDHATQDGPQIITRRGDQVVVVVAMEEWHRKADRSGSLAEFFAASPLRDSGLEFERTNDEPRDVEL
jgi:prevent-host-death family protein